MDRKKILAIGLLFICTLLFCSALSYGADSSELSNIKALIHARGLRWLANETSISRLSPAGRKTRLGLFLPQAVSDKKSLSARSLSEIKEAAATLPVSLDWRNNGGNYVTPVRDQGNCGSCWAFATAGALEASTLIADGTPGIDLNLAEQILVSCSGAGDCNGGYIDTASDFIRDTGLPYEACYPYTAANGACGNACSDWPSLTRKITGWSWVTLSSPVISAIKSALFNYGPIVTTMDVYTDFFYYNGGVYSYASGKYQGGHAVLIVGYDDSGQYLIVKNSWGTGWGESGYFRIAYSELSDAVSFGSYTMAYSSSAESDNITVTSPNGGDTWQAGTNGTIRWTYTGNPGSYVRIDLLKNGSINSTITTSAPVGANGSGSYNWAIPSAQTVGTDYAIRITSTSNGSFTDTSDSTFTILGPSITVTSPNGGETWQAGSTQTIKWSSTGGVGSYVKIELLNGGTATTITSSTLTSMGSYSWTIPLTQAQGSNYMIRISDSNNSATQDTSNASFTIQGAPAAGITVTSPNGGETWQRRATKTILWTYRGNAGYYVKIELLKNGVLKNTVTTRTSIGKGGSGSYSWRIPSNQTTGTDYKIRITSTSNSSMTDSSDNNFGIY